MDTGRNIQKDAWTKTRRLTVYSLKSSFNFSGLDAASADVHLPYSTMIVDSDTLNIGIPFSLCMDIRVADFVAGYLTLTADFTLSGQSQHLLRSPSQGIYDKTHWNCVSDAPISKLFTNAKYYSTDSGVVKHFLRYNQKKYWSEWSPALLRSPF